MYTNIFDSHAHYSDEAYDEDREQVLGSLPSSGVVGLVECGCDLASSAKSLRLAESHGFVFAACGIQPCEACDAPESFVDSLSELLRHDKCVAVGEIGLEYHYDYSPRDVQLDVFEKQLVLANDFDLPVIIHNREAHEDSLSLLKKHRPKGVMHCFSGSVELARELLSLGMYVGLGGAVTFKNAKKPLAVAEYVPLERILLETDCPYMTPVPHRGERNTSAHIPLVAQKIAEIKQTTAQEVLNASRENINRLFNI